MMLNSDHEALGMDSYQMSAYWQNKSQQEAIDKADSINRQEIKDAYNQAIIDLQTIIDRANPTTPEIIWSIKRLAEIQKKELLYHQSEMME